MKYLTTYKLFESNSKDILSNLDDILLDLKDDGFIIRTHISTDSYLGHYVESDRIKDSDDIKRMYLDISKDSSLYEQVKDFSYSEIQKTIEHVISYLKNNGLTIFRIAMSATIRKGGVASIEELEKDPNRNIGNYLKFYFEKCE